MKYTKIENNYGATSYISEDGKIELIKGWNGDIRMTVYYVKFNGEIIHTEIGLKKAKAFAETL